ncbi:membrane integrity-associated transporter subunit PqiC [Loktanella agnita]|uniref:PqiC family protein n=1 Tax=Loktanella agnita TaxID=287097 RepID=UPI0039866A9D
MLKRLAFLTIATLSACASPERLSLVALDSQLELRPLVSSAVVRTITLPTYAAVEEIAAETGEGLIASNEDVLWADDPQRAMTLVVARNLADILNTDVGADPWPFVDLPDVAIDIRVERMLAGADGVFRLSGQFYVGGDGISFPNSTHTFAITKPLPDQTLTGLATAQAQAVLSLSEQVARTLAR